MVIINVKNQFKDVKNPQSILNIQSHQLEFTITRMIPNYSRETLKKDIRENELCWIFILLH